MKKFLIFILVLIMAMSFVACDPEPDPIDDPIDDPPVTENTFADAVANLPDSDAVDVVWDRLAGYWSAADNLFVAFTYQDGVAGIEYGLWQTEWWRFGALVDANSTGEYKSTLTIFIEAREASEMYDALPEATEKIFIDLSGLEQDGKINIKVGNNGDGDWHTYAYGGATAQEAFENYGI